MSDQKREYPKVDPRNVMRHQYRELTAQDKEDMKTVKDLGLAFYDELDKLGSSRELSLAKTKIEEAVMWAVKHITG
jgi:phosphoribosylaminoimidazole-succinocarboxamide synthase